MKLVVVINCDEQEILAQHVGLLFTISHAPWLLEETITAPVSLNSG
jgi:hypothetical protein